MHLNLQYTYLHLSSNMNERNVYIHCCIAVTAEHWANIALWVSYNWYSLILFSMVYWWLPKQPQGWS